MDFKNLNGVWKLKRFCINCIELFFKCFSVLVSFVFNLYFSLILIFRCIKPSLKALFSKFCLLLIIVQPFISLMTKFEVYKVFSS